MSELPSISPVEFTSLVELLRKRATQKPQHPVYTFLEDGEQVSQCLTFAELDRRARAVAALLQSEKLAGERALLLFPSGLDFIVALFGCLYARTLAVPIYPARSARGFTKVHSILRNAQVRAILTNSEILLRMRPWFDQAQLVDDLRFLTTDDLSNGFAEEWQEPGVTADTLALLQYTSGSTAEPKGVMVSHGNLLHNERLIHAAFKQSESSVVAGWLPLHHDMGLIGNIIQPLYAGSTCVFMPPLAFLQKPVRWLQCISRFRATTSGGPNFAYELCVQKITAESCENLDLNRWEVAFNGAEPVRLRTLDQFAAKFAPYGFRRSAFHPCYGLAEATLMVSGGRPATDDGGNRQRVSCGSLGDEVRLAVVDPATHRRCESAYEGEIWVQSPSVAEGYWGRPELSASVFRARLDDHDGTFLRTGDLGFYDGNELFITGRLKELIIIRGRNHHAHDIELSVERSHPAFLSGSGAAFSLEVAGEERLIVVHELSRHYEGDAEAAAAAARSAISEEHEVSVHEIVLVRQGEIPRTTSGKIRRFACRDLYLSSDLRIIYREVANGAQDLTVPELLMHAGTPQQFETHLKQLIAQTLRIEPERVRDDATLVSLGLDSLGAVELKHHLEQWTGVAFSQSTLLEDSNVASLVQAILHASPGNHATGVLVGDEYLPEQPLSYNQKSLWFLHELAPNSGAYNLAAAARVHGLLNVSALRAAFQTLMERHASLRTNFVNVDGEPALRTNHSETVFFSEVDAKDWSERYLQENLTREAERPFDLERDSLLRVTLYRRPADEYVLLFTTHHIVNDFWSFEVLLGDLSNAYQCHASNSVVETLTPVQPQYIDYAKWQQRMINSPQGLRAWEYWQRQLAAELPDLNLPADRPRPVKPAYRGGVITLAFGKELTARLKALSQSANVTLYVTLLSAFQVLLRHYTGQEEVLVASPFAGRTSPQWTRVVGYFVNPLVMRASLSGDPPFNKLLARTRQTVLEAFEHGDYPFALLVKRLASDRQPGFGPLFRVMFSLQKSLSRDCEQLAAVALGQAGARLELENLVVESLELRRTSSQCDLHLTMAELGGELKSSLNYDSDLFDAATAVRLLQHFNTLLSCICDAPGQRISSLSLPAESARHQLLVEWNDTRSANVPVECLHRLFEKQAATTPAAIGVVDAGGQLTYRELNNLANRLAVYLRRVGVGPEVRVGVMLNRSSELLIALLGVLKAGGAYVPLDATNPPERLQYIMNDACAPVLLTTEELARRIDTKTARVVCLDSLRDDLKAIDIESDPASEGVSDNLAYIIYTSGSTGRPKGVAITHGNVVSLLHWAGSVFSPAELSGVLASTSVCFDLSVFEIFAPLSCGGKVILADDFLQLPQLAAADQVTLINTVPSTMAALISQKAVPASVVTVNLAGEPLKQVLVDQAYNCSNIARVLNLYGPTEDTTYSTWVQVQAAGSKPPSIGRPITNSRAYILDESMNPVPIGVTGELYLGGTGLARGYLNRPDLTAEKFVPDPLSGDPGARLYRTGDQARYLPNGEIEFLGRLDNQVKLRGYRIELGEIETALEEHSTVVESAVVVLRNQTDDTRLVAYFASKEDRRTTVEELRRHLRSRLPTYMQPASFVCLSALPRTPNGKIDRRSLPKPDGAQLLATTGYEPPNSPTQATLSQIWAELLDVERVGIHDNFFDLGGHSLLAVRLSARLREALQLEVPVSAVFETPSIASLAAHIDQLKNTHVIPPIRAATDRGPAPLSSSQRRLWFLHQLVPETSAYHMSGAINLQGSLRPEVLEKCLQEIIHRHDILRTSFPIIGEQPLQVVDPISTVRLPIVDLRMLAESERKREARRLIAAQSARPFDLAAGPLLRVTLVQLSDEEHVWFICLHHIVADGWSLEIIAHELATLYGAFVQAKPSPLSAPRVQYSDYAYWEEQQQLAGGALAGQLNYWKQQLADLPPPLKLPSYRWLVGADASKGGSRSFVISTAVTERLKALNQAEGATLFMTMHAALAVLLYRYTGQADILIGTPVAGRNRTEIESSIGCFVNMLTLRTKLTGDLSFRELLRRSRKTALEAYTNQDLPFEKIIEELRPARAASQMPFFQVVLAAQNDSVRKVTLPGLTASSFEVETTATKFDLSVLFNEADKITGVLEYNAALFDAGTVDRLLSQFNVLLESIAGNVDQRLDHLQILTNKEQHELVFEWNDTHVTHSHVVCAHQWFESQAERTPKALAISDGRQRLTYRELNLSANQLARHLRRHGVDVETPVGVLLERSPKMIVALLSILKAGGNYIPLDPAWPSERLAFMLEDARAGALVTEESLTMKLPGFNGPVILMNDSEPRKSESQENLQQSLSAENLAYVVYTSGSTGTPKGVAITHGSLVNLIEWHQRTYGVGPEDRATLLAGLSFDASVWELWPYLSSGASIHLPDETTRTSPQLLMQWLSDQLITHCFLPTPMAEAVLEENCPDNMDLRTLLTGGDVLHKWPKMVLDFDLFNHYGPSENTVVTTAAKIGQQRPRPERPPIGRPISNVDVYLLNAQLQLVPVGVEGEVYIGGAGLARCYLHRPDLTAAQFIPHPYGTELGARLYRTGDVARYLPDGRLEFLRRDDQQVKLRAIRIELSEIEAALLQHPALHQAAVVLHENDTGQKQLVAFLVAAPGLPPPTAELPTFLKHRLPEYMIPNVFAELDSLPLTPHGKTDRQALSVLAGQARSQSNTSTRPLTPIEEMLANIWSELLGVPEIGTHDDFFALGGHSLLAARTVARVRSVFGVELSPAGIFENPTLSSLALAIKSALDNGESESVPLVRRAESENHAPLSFSQERLWFLAHLNLQGVYNISAAIQLSGQLDVRALKAALDEIVDRHQILRTTFDMVGGKPAQMITQMAIMDLTLVNLGELNKADVNLAALMQEQTRQRFDLRTGPLIRAILFQLAPDQHVLLIVMHHIISDAWSLAIFTKELTALYEAFAQGRPSPLIRLTTQYADFTAWERSWLDGRLERQSKYWQRQLEGLATLPLPTDHPRSSTPSFRGASHSFNLPVELSVSLRLLSRQQNATLFMTLLAAFKVLLSRWSKQEEIVVGTDVANRNSIETESLIGFFVNTLVLRTNLSGNPTFRELLRRVRSVAIGAYANQEMPFQLLVNELQPLRDSSRNPLFQVMFILQNAPPPSPQLSELVVKPIEVPFDTSPFDLTVSLQEETSGGITGTFRYSVDIFEAATIKRMSADYIELLRAAASHPDARLNELALPARKMDQLFATRPKKVVRSSAELVKPAPAQTDSDFPFVLTPAVAGVDLVAWAGDQHELIEQWLAEHGALLFKDFRINSLDQFEKFARASSHRLIDYTERSSPRTQLQRNIYTSTDHPADQIIHLHNEQSYTLDWPMKIWFCCLEPATTGGATLIANSHRILQRLDPNVVNQFTLRQVMYVRNYGNGLGLSWQEVFQTSEPAVVEEICRNAAIDFEWRHDSHLRTRQIRPAIRRHPKTGAPLWFNHASFFHLTNLELSARESVLAAVGEDEIPTNTFYGDGSPIEIKVLDHIRGAMQRETISVRWQRGNVLMLDNMLTAHGRESFTGPRYIAVAMGDPYSEYRS